MARTFSGTATTTPAASTITGNKARRIYVQNTGDTNALQVNVPAVTGTDYDTIQPGDTEYYETFGSPSVDQITSFNTKTASSTTTWTAGVVSGEA